MRLVVWNCAGAFHRKWRHLRDLQPDVAVVPESCQPERVTDLGFSAALWTGRLPYKGLALYSFGEWQVSKLPVRTELEWVLPARVDGPSMAFDLYGIWAMNHRARTHPDHLKGVRQPTALIESYEIEADRSPTVVAGDFNGNVRWDTSRRPDFQAMCDLYRDAGLTSIYHDRLQEPFGGETQPTHWWRDRKIDGPTYHIDYVWASRSIADRATIEVGSFDPWVTGGGSDHAAIVVDVAT